MGATGSVGPVYIQKQPDPGYPIRPGNSYFQVRLVQAQAYYAGGRLPSKPALVVAKSAVAYRTRGESQFASPLQSIHSSKVVKRNMPCNLGLSINLTDWLPATEGAVLRNRLEFEVITDAPLRKLADKLNKIDLTSILSLVSIQAAVAVKASEITGWLLSDLLKEGDHKPVLSELLFDLGSDRDAGYYAVFESRGGPTKLWLESEQEPLKYSTGDPMKETSYAVLRICAIPRLGSNEAREEDWWKLLQFAKNRVLHDNPSGKKEKTWIINQWKQDLRVIRQMARSSDRFLFREVEQVIDDAHLDVETHLFSGELQSFSDDALEATWQEVLGVRTRGQLLKLVKDYREDLDTTRRLLLQYSSE